MDEEGFIEYLRARFPTQGSVLGIGDDCAVIPFGEGKAALVTTDALVEGVHFLKEEISPHDLGYKTVAVSVSDIAAMGGDPKYAFFSIAIAKTIKREWVHQMMEGMRAACSQWNIALLGGDTVGSKRDLFLNLTLIGVAPLEQVKYRHDARPGDVICVSAPLGDSGGGLKGLQESRALTGDMEVLLRAHFHPQPAVEQGRWLARQPGVHAMMDLSDGLACDLPRLLKSSRLGGRIEVSKIPLSMPLQRLSAMYGWDPLELAVAAGEDYSLLVTVDPQRAAVIQHDFAQQFGSPLYDIGVVTDPPIQLIYLKQGSEITLRSLPFDHFQSIF